LVAAEAALHIQGIKVATEEKAEAAEPLPVTVHKDLEIQTELTLELMVA
jgi:hypothetical protein